MKKVTAFIGSARKQATYEAVREFEKNLNSYTEIDFEYVFLKDYQLEFCRGCKLCFDKGEEICPIRDDRDVLIDKINHSDGVIFATPNYSFHVSASMKNLLDRLAFVFHRPRFFGKTFTSIVIQGIFGGNSIVKYLMSRTSMKAMLSDEFCDYRHYKEKGWFESDYYYKVSLNPIKKLAGLIFDFMGRLMSRQN